MITTLKNLKGILGEIFNWDEFADAHLPGRDLQYNITVDPRVNHTVNEVYVAHHVDKYRVGILVYASEYQRELVMHINTDASPEGPGGLFQITRNIGTPGKRLFVEEIDALISDHIDLSRPAYEIDNKIVALIRAYCLAYGIDFESKIQ